MVLSSEEGIAAKKIVHWHSNGTLSDDSIQKMKTCGHKKNPTGEIVRLGLDLEAESFAENLRFWKSGSSHSSLFVEISDIASIFSFGKNPTEIPRFKPLDASRNHSVSDLQSGNNCYLNNSCHLTHWMSLLRSLLSPLSNRKTPC